MSYIQIEIGGELRGWKVNQMTIELWSKMINEDAFNSSSNYGAVYAGLIANCEAKRIDPDFTYEQVCDWVDELNLTEKGLAVLDKIKEQFEASQYYIKLVEKIEAELASVKQELKQKPKKKAVKR